MHTQHLFLSFIFAIISTTSVVICPPPSNTSKLTSAEQKAEDETTAAIIKLIKANNRKIEYFNTKIKVTSAEITELLLKQEMKKAI